VHDNEPHTPGALEHSDRFAELVAPPKATEATSPPLHDTCWAHQRSDGRAGGAAASPEAVPRLDLSSLGLQEEDSLSPRTALLLTGSSAWGSGKSGGTSSRTTMRAALGKRMKGSSDLSTSLADYFEVAAITAARAQGYDTSFAERSSHR
jgi:hypothetical protein